MSPADPGRTDPHGEQRAAYKQSRSGAGWHKNVAPPDPATRPAGLPPVPTLALELENARFRHALELIAYYEAQQDECADAMRQTARKALGRDVD